MSDKEFLIKTLFQLFFLFRINLAFVAVVYSVIALTYYIRTLMGYEAAPSQKQQWRLAWDLGSHLFLIGVCLAFLWFSVVRIPPGVFFQQSWK